MFETAVVALATIFATVSPLDVAAIFAALTTGVPVRERRKLAFRGILIASIILLVFAVFGKVLLKILGISLPALRTAGGYPSTPHRHRDGLRPFLGCNFDNGRRNA